MKPGQSMVRTVWRSLSRPVTGAPAALAVGVLALGGMVAGSPAAQASPFTGTHVTFSDVNQSVSATSGTPANDIFGTPKLTGDTLEFTPDAFNVLAPDPGPAYNFIDGTLTMDIQALPTHTINDITISEHGDYSLTGTGDAGTLVSVATPIFIQIVGINGQGVNPILVTAAPTFQGDNGGGGNPTGLFTLADNAGQGTIWRGSVTVDLDAALASHNLTGHVTHVLLSLDNSLLAHDQAGSGASIAKKGLNISVAPEPGTLALIALGVGLLLIRRRKATHAA